MMTGRTLASPVVAIATIAMLAACGGSSDRPAAHARGLSSAAKAGTATAQITSAPPVTSSTRTAATPTPVATAGRACTAADLTAVFLGQNGASGRVVLSFALRNRGNATCHTYGWPGVEFLGAGGQALRTQSRRVTADVLGSTPASVIALAPGEWASFRVIATDQNSRGGTAGCETAHALQIIAPDDTTPISVAIPGGAYECAVATVSALQAGDVAGGTVTSPQTG
jgi:hypothetical protein